MYELIQAAENSFYIQAPVKVGVVRLTGNDVCLIDSGNDKNAGRKIRQVLDANGFHLTAIYNTHSHADHIGGNRYLQNQTGCRIFVPEGEYDSTRRPLLESSFLYGGYPPQDLQHKFLLAEESDVAPLTQQDLPAGFESISLPGHCVNMVGFRTPDNVVYLADCLCSEETLEKYQISFLYDVAAYLDTLEMVKTLKAALFVPAHAPATDSIRELADYNIQQVHSIAKRLAAMCSAPIGLDDLLQTVFTQFGLTMSFEQYALVGSTVRSYLAYLKNTGILTAFFDNNRLLWQKI